MKGSLRTGGAPALRAAAAAHFLLLLGLSAHFASAAYFYVQESQDKCFIESVPTGVALTASYKNHENPGVTCSIVFKDPTGVSAYSREVLPADVEGKVTHMTTTTGEYQVCISCASSKWFNTQLLKWSLSIELGDTDINIDDLAKKDHVNSVHLKLQAIARRVEAMQAENDYERVQEERFQRTSEAINSRVVWFSVLQLLLLCACTVVSIFYLVRYFHAHKII
ncbi:emp24/gp25L/p24 family domain-containing, transmembrane protein, putative [Eimeria brunetti]|uniref:Emp24/gp25L/p24 family domain-containing, transmembrane protein, putative n=1 Tax=Eimeria brunetti TaxID=51314 RepID=U6LBY8_9EIME|nr:emp24/gp25L/p24 family domain-containing, transmembrane protein, putative [Eimeria brunetti]